MPPSTSLCPLCRKLGLQWKLKAFSVNHNEAVYLCCNPSCPYPVGAVDCQNTWVVERRTRDDVISRKRKTSGSVGSRSFVSGTSSDRSQPSITSSRSAQCHLSSAQTSPASSVFSITDRDDSSINQGYSSSVSSGRTPSRADSAVSTPPPSDVNYPSTIDSDVLSLLKPSESWGDMNSYTNILLKDKCILPAVPQENLEKSNNIPPVSLFDPQELGLGDNCLVKESAVREVYSPYNLVPKVERIFIPQSNSCLNNGPVPIPQSDIDLTTKSSEKTSSETYQGLLSACTAEKQWLPQSDMSTSRFESNFESEDSGRIFTDKNYAQIAVPKSLLDPKLNNLGAENEAVSLLEPAKTCGDPVSYVICSNSSHDLKTAHCALPKQPVTPACTANSTSFSYSQGTLPPEAGEISSRNLCNPVPQNQSANQFEADFNALILNNIDNHGIDQLNSSTDIDFEDFFDCVPDSYELQDWSAAPAPPTSVPPPEISPVYNKGQIEVAGCTSLVEKTVVNELSGTINEKKQSEPCIQRKYKAPTKFGGEKKMKKRVEPVEPSLATLRREILLKKQADAQHSTKGTSELAVTFSPDKQPLQGASENEMVLFSGTLLVEDFNQAREQNLLSSSDQVGLYKDEIASVISERNYWTENSSGPVQAQSSTDELIGVFKDAFSTLHGESDICNEIRTEGNQSGFYQNGPLDLSDNMLQPVPLPVPLPLNTVKAEPEISPPLPKPKLRRVSVLNKRKKYAGVVEKNIEATRKIRSPNKKKQEPSKSLEQQRHRTIQLTDREKSPKKKQYIENMLAPTSSLLSAEAATVLSDPVSRFFSVRGIMSLASKRKYIDPTLPPAEELRKKWTSKKLLNKMLTGGFP